ncbi:DUF4810 domain-containing protein [Acinetobacter sp. ANC 4636]
MKKILPWVSLGLAIGLTGCASQPNMLYHWGNYPQQVYLGFNQPEKASPAKQISVLEADVEKARAKNQAIPPGLYAHLGLLYSNSDTQKAAQYFELEKQSYPEASVLMNRLLAQLKAN